MRLIAYPFAIIGFILGLIAFSLLVGMRGGHEAVNHLLYQIVEKKHGKKEG